jgi:hypothetical protein
VSKSHDQCKIKYPELTQDEISSQQDIDAACSPFTMTLLFAYDNLQCLFYLYSYITRSHTTLSSQNKKNKNIQSIKTQTIMKTNKNVLGGLLLLLESSENYFHHFVVFSEKKLDWEDGFGILSRIIVSIF